MPLDSTSMSPIANRMREILGPNGEHWGKGGYHRDGKYCLMGAYFIAKFKLDCFTNESDCDGKYCLMGAYFIAKFKLDCFTNESDFTVALSTKKTAHESWIAEHESVAEIVRRLVNGVVNAHVFNDRATTTFADIVRVIDAIAETETEQALAGK